MQLSRTTRVTLISAYWSIVFVGSLALLLSIVATLWGPRQPNASATVSQRRTWCIGQVALLHAELGHQTQAAIDLSEPITSAREKLRQRWQRRWDHHLQAVQAQCRQPDDVAAALAQVDTLAKRYEAIVVAWQNAQETLETPIQTTLRCLADPWATAPQSTCAQQGSPAIP